jgi:membrane protein
MFNFHFISFFRHLKWRTLKKTFARTIETRLLGLAAEIAFNTMLSLFPAIIALLTAIGLFAESLRNTFIQLATELSKIVPQEAWILIRDFATHEIANSKNSSLFSLSFVITLWTASGAINTAMTALDQIQQIHPKKMRPFWQAKLISLGLTIGTILLLMLASFLVFISDLLLGIVVNNNTYLIFISHLWQFLRWPLALATVATAFAFVYRYGPSKCKTNTPLIPGAILAAILMIVSSLQFALAPSPLLAKRVLKASLLYFPIILLGVGAERIVAALI